MSHPSRVKQMYSQPIHLAQEWIEITRGRVHFHRDSTGKSPSWQPSFKPVTFRPRSSLICSRTFQTWFCFLIYSFISVKSFNALYAKKLLCKLALFINPKMIFCVPRNWQTEKHLFYSKAFYKLFERPYFKTFIRANYNSLFNSTEEKTWKRFPTLFSERGKIIKGDFSSLRDLRQTCVTRFKT